jgi:hypothetical protein
MPGISMGDLVEVASRMGPPKTAKVHAIKNRKPYSPATDFYKPLREALVDIHQNGKPSSDLLQFVNKLTDQKKKTNYDPAIKGYIKWWASQSLNWSPPIKGTYSTGGFDINVNPELGLVIGGQRFLVKLYMNAEPATNLRLQYVTALMELVLRNKAQPNDVLGVLDVRRAKLFTSSPPSTALKASIDAEIAYIASVWPFV